MTLEQSDFERNGPAMTADLDLDVGGSSRGTSWWVIAIGVLFLLAAVAFALFARFGSDERLTVGPMNQGTGGDAALVATTAPPESSTTTAAPSVEPEPSAAPLPTTTTIATTTSVTGVPLEGDLQAGAISLSGTVPSAETGASYVSLLEGFVGAGNVSEAFTVTPDSPEPTSFRLNVTDTVLFGAGGETISPQFFPLLDQIAGFLATDPNVTLIVEGHTDSEGSAVENLALSQRRADAVRTYLEQQGINGFRLDARGRGDTEPVADNSTEDGRQQNRRIELLLVGIQTGNS